MDEVGQSLIAPAFARSRPRSWSMLAVILVLLSCGDSRDESRRAELDPLTDLELEGTWSIEKVSVRGADIQVAVSLVVANREFRVQGSCNKAFGQVVVSDANRISFSPLEYTKAGCGPLSKDPHEPVWDDGALFDLLSDVRTYRRTAEGLELIAERGTVTLREL